nr:MAG TPA: hypothetical protein [Caudoviricetes sp.]
MWCYKWRKTETSKIIIRSIEVSNRQPIHRKLL